VKRKIMLKHEFVEYIPNNLVEGTIYISITFATVAHKCCCGCGHEVITPISPTDWKLTFDGQSISLYPSIGNWGFACQSHYWIERNIVKWAPQWSKEKIKDGRTHDAINKQRYFVNTKNQASHDEIDDAKIAGGKAKKSLWQKFKKWLS
jgi:hypothetical protein